MGILAIAGAVKGAGEGITATGEQQQKMNMAQKLNELQQSREEAIERLRGGEQEKLQSAGQEFEKEQTQTKIGAASRAAGATREFEQSENAKNRATKLQVSQTSKEARIGAAEVTAKGRVEQKGPPKIWSPVKLPTTGFDPSSKLPTTSTTLVNYNNFTGRQYMQLGDKFVPFDAQKNGPANDPKSINRAPADEVQDLLTHPLDTVPDGPNAGMTRADVFESAHGYLPSAWTAAANAKANPQQHPTLFSSSESHPYAKDNPDAGAADNAAQAEIDASNSAPPFQSQAMSSYSANP